uniref:Ig-like domain-containing protein n=1 Tax=Sipha flava TaxID=143950 RepID=A0A2S2R7X3_9HEMI
MAMFRSSSSLHAVFVYLLLVHIVRSLHNVSIHFIPPAVERGQNVMLYCNYDLDGAPMLSVKWYRGSHEFYRYSPGMIPTTQTFPFHGLNVDLSVSNATQVFLRDVGFNLSGNLSCEVTTDGPSFKIASASKRIIVVELPKSKPVIVTDKDKYDPGDTLVANCTSPASRPAAGLTFFLNNMPIGSPETLKYSTSNFLKLSMLTVTLKLNQSHFKDGRKLLLQCTALINTLYKQSSELRLPIKSTEPVPEKVTSPSSGCRLTCSNKYLTMITTLVLLCNVFR